MSKVTKVRRFAALSRDGKYRWRLSRKWGEGPQVLFIMLNPSYADAKIDSPTIKRCMHLANQWGFSGIQVVNLFAYRSPNPRVLLQVEDPVGKLNDTYITMSADRYWPRVVAWGSHAPQERVDEVLEILNNYDLACLGITRSGAPLHPLGAKPDARLMPWPVIPTIPEELS